jgi:hypothetical protein
MSDAKLKGKAALQASGVIGPPSIPKEAPDGAGTPAGENGHRKPALTAAQARANVERDARKASVVGNSRQAPLERALEEPETRVSEEGTNLLKEHNAE